MSQAIFDLGLEKEKVFYTINTLFDLLKEKQSEIESLKAKNIELQRRYQHTDTQLSDADGHYALLKKETEQLKEFKAKLDAGWIAIPEEPTDEIIEAMNEFDICHDYSDMDGAYRAIIQVIKGE